MASKKERKERRLKVAFGIFVSVLMVTSIGGFFINQYNASDTLAVNISDQIYNFKLSTQSYKVNSPLTGDEVEFFFLPSEINYISIPPEVTARIFGSPSIIITYNPNDQDLTYQDGLRYQLNSDLIKLGKYVQNGVTESRPDVPLPIFTCDNATGTQTVVLLRTANKTNIYESGDCITIESFGTDYYKIRDRIAYYLYGFMVVGQ
jgi:hypothetical protein